MSYDPLHASDLTHPPHKPGGFSCEKCGAPLFTARTVRAAPGIVIRYRQCETPRCTRKLVATEERLRAARK